MLRKNMERFKALMRRYNSDYYFTERYLQRKLCPVIAIAKIPELMKRPDALQVVQRIYCSIMVKAYLQCLMGVINKSKEHRQRLTIEASVLQVIGHGDCGELSSRLIIDLMMMEDEFPLIIKVMLNEDSKNNHAFVVVQDAEGNKIALDPYFNICCLFEDYRKQKAMVDYFEAVVPGWKFPETLAATEYRKKDYVPMRATLLTDLMALTKISDPDLEKYKTSFRQFAELRGKPFSFKHVKPFLIECFMESVRMEGVQLHPLQIEAMIDPQSMVLPDRGAELFFFSMEAKEKIVADINNITGSVGYKNLHECLDQGLQHPSCFSRALRMACTGTGEKAYLVVKRLLDEKHILLIQVNEQAGAGNKAAIHYALEKGDERIINLLLEHGADRALEDANGNSVEKYFQRAAQKKI